MVASYLGFVPWPVTGRPDILSSVIVLGLNGFAGADHDPAAALVMDDVLVSAVEEERLSRVRHAPGSQPMAAARAVLDIAGLTTRDVDVVAHGWHPAALGTGNSVASEVQRIRAAFAAAGLALRPDCSIEFVEHHVAHFYSGIPFVPEGLPTAVIDGLVLDGAGESTAGARFRLDRTGLAKVWNLGVKGSLGLTYEAATLALGFGRGQEGKTMGLASYGRPAARTSVGAPPDDRFPGDIPVLGDRGELRTHHRSLILQFRSLVPRGASFNHRADLALGVQSMLEERVLALLEEIREPAPVLILAGGVALNCTMNGRLTAWCRANGVTLVVPPAANDAGVAAGAAVACSGAPAACRSRVGAALGRGFTPAEIVDRLRPLGAEVRDGDPDRLAVRLLEGAFCGWFEGRAELGPRALGRRSVLTRPDDAITRDRLNVTKGREAWRPLAPSIRAEDFAAAFDGSPSAYMLVASQVRAATGGRLDGVTHVDNSARPQSVDRDREPVYADLLDRVGAATGIGCVTCTSFNVAGEPIVGTPEDAWNAGRRMGLDLLAGDGWQIDLRRS